MNKALNYLGLAKKAGLLEIGEENTGAAIRGGKARLVLLASDASDNAGRRAEGFLHGKKTPMTIHNRTTTDAIRQSPFLFVNQVLFRLIGTLLLHRNVTNFFQTL